MLMFNNLIDGQWMSDGARSRNVNPSDTNDVIGEAVRGTQDPLYGYYTLGKLMILKLRDDYRAKMGAQYSLAGFHDALLSHGDPPVYYLRQLLLGPDDKGSLL